MIDEYNVNIEGNLKLDHKEALAHISTRLKEVLNPTPCSDPSQFYRITLDSVEFPLEIVSTLLCDKSSSNVTGYVISHIDENLNISGLVSGIDTIFVGYANNKIFIGSELQNTLSINSEVFIPTDTKNHIISVEAVSLQDVKDELYVEDIEDNIENTETEPFTFYYRDKDGNAIQVESGDVIVEILNSKNSETSDVTKGLEQNIPIIVTDQYGDPIGTSEGEVKADLSEVNLTLDLNIPEEYVLPVANRVLGGIKANATASELGTDYRFPVKLLSTLNPWGYVEIPGIDAHRFENMDEVPEEVRRVGSIVEYIGKNSADYTKGYFYQFTPTNFKADLDQSPKWQFIELSEDTGQAVADYNVLVDYLITRGDLIIDLDPDLEISQIDDQTPFIVFQNDAVLAHFTYAEIKDIFKVLINPTYLNLLDYQQGIVHLEIPDDALAWKQKNVQPMVKVGSALTYKGPITWDELQLIQNPAIGDFYTVTDKSNQEYFWNGENWEFMGDVFTLNGKLMIKTKIGNNDPVTVTTFEANQSDTSDITFIQGENVTLTPDSSNNTITIAAKDTTYTAGNGIDITSNQITVNYDDTTIKQDVFGALYVNGVLTDTTYSAGDNISITGNNNSISAKGYTYTDMTDSFAEGDSTATGSNSHSEGNHSLSKGANSHAEGYYSIAYENNSHAEGERTSSCGYGSHSEGSTTVAFGVNSHSEGEGSEQNIRSTIKFSWDSENNPNEIVASSSDHGIKVGNILYYQNAYSNVTAVSGVNITVDYDLSESATNVQLSKIKGISYGDNSHAEGTKTITVGNCSHTEGKETITRNEAEHAEGKYNISNLGDSSSKNTIHSTGIGTADNSRKNAFEIMENGDVYIINNHNAGEYDGTNAGLNGVRTLQELLGDENVIETIKVNGTAQTVTNKTVDITVPTVNDAEFSVNVKVGSSTSEIADFTANLNSNDDITFEQGTNITFDTTGTRTIKISATDTTYSAGTGLSLSGTTINHSNSITAGTASGSATGTLSFGGSFDIPTVSYDAQGHITGKGITTMTMPANPNTDTQADWNESDTNSAAYINNKPSLATVATSGLYSDLSGTPTLAAVATSGSYTDLSNTPSIPDAIPTGTIQMYAGGSAPTGWLVCDGSAVSRETYSSLFTVCGTTYGSGDGSTTFNLPNFSGRFPLGVGNAGTTYGTSHSLASTGGDEKVKLSSTESGVASHSHEILHGGTGTIGYEGVSFTTQSLEYTAGNGASNDYPIIKSAGVSADAVDAHNNMPPFLTVNFIIKY